MVLPPVVGDLLLMDCELQYKRTMLIIPTKKNEDWSRRLGEVGVSSGIGLSFEVFPLEEGFDTFFDEGGLGVEAV